MLFTANCLGVEAASVKVATTEKLVAEATAGSVELRWRKVSKATGYKVYQMVDGKYKAIKTVQTNKYTVNNLTASETYKFAVKTYRKVNGKTYWSSDFTSVKAKTSKMGKTPTPKATGFNTSVTLNWSEVEGATGYRVYQYSPSKDKYVVKASIKGTTTYKVTGLKENKTYKFKIKPYAKTAKGVVWNTASSAVAVQTIDKTKAKFKDPVIGSKGVNLSWGKVSGATAYRLYKVENGKYVQIASGIKTTSYKVERLESDTEYTFVVRGYKKVNGTPLWFTKSDPLTVKTKAAGTVVKPEETTTEATTQPSTEPTTQPSTEPSTEPTTESTTVTTTVAESTTVAEAESTTEITAESTTIVASESTTVAASESTTETTETTTEQVTTAPTTTEPSTTEPVTTAPATTESTTVATTQATTVTTTATTTTTTTTTQPTTVTTTAATTTTQPTTQATTVPTTQPTTVPTTQPTTTPSTEAKAYRIDNYKKILDKQEIYFKISSNYSDGSNVPVEFARNSKGDMYMDTTADGMQMKLYYTKSSDKMEAYMYLSEGMVDELMAGENELLKIFLKGVVSLLDTTPLYTEVPENERDDMKMDEILDSMMIKNVGEITSGQDLFNGKTVDCETFVDTKTGDTKKYYFEGDKLIGVDTFYKNEKLGMDRIMVHDVSNSVSDSLFKAPSFKINLPAGMM